jgi:hypothetical protein
MMHVTLNVILLKRPEIPTGTAGVKTCTKVFVNGLTSDIETPPDLRRSPPFVSVTENKIELPCSTMIGERLLLVVTNEGLLVVRVQAGFPANSWIGGGLR